MPIMANRPLTFRVGLEEALIMGHHFEYRIKNAAPTLFCVECHKGKNISPQKVDFEDCPGRVE